MPANKTTRFPATAAVLRFVFSRRIVYTLIVAATVVAAAWQVENHRGRQRWVETAARITAGGDSIDWTPPLSAPVPDSLNAARHPVFANAFVPADNPFGYLVDFSGLLPDATAGIPDDLTSIDTTDPHNVLAATSSYGEFLAGLHQAFQRPHCLWFTFDSPSDLDPFEYPVPVMSTITSSVSTFFDLAALRTGAHLTLGDPATAARELTALIALARSTESCGSLVAALIETAALQLALPELTGLVTRPGWDDESLATIADSLSGIRLVDKINAGLRRERTASVNFVLTNKRGLDHPDGSLSHRLLAATTSFVPNGWRQQNAANLATWWEQGALVYYDPPTGRLDPGPHPSLKDFLTGPLTPYTFLANTACPSIGSLYYETARVQYSTALLQLLCAIERHRLEHGQRPASLTGLVPHFITAIPLDPVTGLPPHYTADKTGNLTLATLDWHRTANPDTFVSRVTTSPAPAQISRNK